MDTFPKIATLFGETLKPHDKDSNKPRLKKAAIRVGTLRLVRSGLSSRVPYSVRVRSGSRWYGSILQSGQFSQFSVGFKGTVPSTVFDTLNELETDPIGCTTKHARLTGRCSFCGLRLTDPRSVRVGYGPICAGNWGLPWGEPPLLETILRS